MKIECPKCAQRIEISTEVFESLRGHPSFDCPACQEKVPVPASRPDGSLGGLAADQLLMRGMETPRPTGGDWSPPDPDELSDAIDDRYEVLRLLGHGGMGAVYQARDKRLSRLVAIKILPAELVDHPGALARFEREARALAALDHPNIIKVHDYGQTSEGSPFFVMEFIRGKDIQALRDGGELDLASALKLVSQVCGALHFAHGKGVIHRDIKPANVLVSEEGVAKVADFGLAKVLGTDSRPQEGAGLTLSGEVMGTPSYMAPEQENGQAVDHRTDIYALGVMLYSLLTGTPPRGAWTLPSKKLSIDVRLDEIVLRALQDDPEARYQAADEFKSDIDSVSEQSGGSALPPGTEAPPLPSTVGGRVPESSHFHSSRVTEPRVEPVTQKTGEGDFMATARSLNNTMLILGLLAMLVIGGLALFLANRKTGDVSNVSQTITNSETRNTFFSQLIATGMASGTDLAGIEVIRPYRDGFIGLSSEPLTEAGALALAENTGAVLLEIPPHPLSKTPAIVTWLRQDIVAEATVRITREGTPHLLEGESVLAATDPAALHPALLHWLPGEPSTRRKEEESPDQAQPPLEPGTEPASEGVTDMESAGRQPTPESESLPVAPPEPAQPEPMIDIWTDTRGREIQARFLRLEGETLYIEYKGKETPIALSRLSPESKALAAQRLAESKP